VRILDAEWARVSWQCVVSQELADPKCILNRETRTRETGQNSSAFDVPIPRKGRHRLRRFEIGRAEFIALSNPYSRGECRNDENRGEGRMAARWGRSTDSQRP
jgi:hypothetical protein